MIGNPHIYTHIMCSRRQDYTQRTIINTLADVKVCLLPGVLGTSRLSLGFSHDRPAAARFWDRACRSQVLGAVDLDGRPSDEARNMDEDCIF